MINKKVLLLLVILLVAGCTSGPFQKIYSNTGEPVPESAIKEAETALERRESLFIKKNGFSKENLAQAGLIILPEDGSRPYDRFRGRLMFPICDESGRVIAFSGRIMTEDKKAAKYVNSPETPLYNKSNVQKQ